MVLSDSAKDILAMLGIEDDNQLVDSGLTKEEVLTLHEVIHNTDEKACTEIWTLIQNSQSTHAFQLLEEIVQPSIHTEDTASFWRAKGLSVRASNCLTKAGISNQEELTSKLTNFDQVFALRNCGRLTAEEIWTFITNSNTKSSPPIEPQLQDTSEYEFFS